MNIFSANNAELLLLIDLWEPKLLELSDEILTIRKNSQQRTIKQIIGHMIDSASNNTHRIIHLQYQPSPLIFPDYANFGNNDKWIAIQNYQSENWENMVQLWKYSNYHFAHILENTDPSKLDFEWISALNKKVTLKDMALDYLNHFKLHLLEINQLLTQ